jgi:hypothetical protein
MKNTVAELKSQIDCCKLLFKFIMGYVDKSENKMIDMEVSSTLSGAGLAMYHECIDAIKSKNAAFTFGELNLLA